MEPAGGCAVKRYFTLSLQSKRSRAGGEIAPVNEVEEGEYKRPGTANQGELRQAGRAGGPEECSSPSSLGRPRGRRTARICRN